MLSRDTRAVIHRWEIGRGIDRETQIDYIKDMNIKSFKEGDIITRNEPMRYKHNNSADSSYCGDRLEFLGLDENAKIIFFKDPLFDEPIDLSYARDTWDEGWILYPETLYQKIKSKLSERNKSPSKKI